MTTWSLTYLIFPENADFADWQGGLLDRPGGIAGGGRKIKEDSRGENPQLGTQTRYKTWLL